MNEKNTLRQLAIIVWLLFTLSFAAQAQVLKPATWSYDVSKKQVTVGEEVELIFNVKIDKDWYLYSSDFDPELGPMVTEFTFQKHPSYELVGKIVPVKPKKKYDDIWGGEYTYFTGTAQFRQKIRVLQPDLLVKGSYEYQVCTDVDGRCIPFDDEFTFTNKHINITAAAAPAAKPATASREPTTSQQPTAPQPTETPAVTTDTATTSAATDTATVLPIAFSDNTATITEQAVAAPLPVTETDGEEGLWGFMLIAFGAGLMALLTPCVFPMVPMTVSFFTNSGGRAKGVLKAFVYGLSIIAIYTIIGTVVAKLFGADGANFISTHWLPNLLFFLVFLVFAMSFFGMFEITLPSSWLTKVDAQADKGGWIGVFFMAFTLVLVSFSCTGPIVGSILVASAGGETIRPVVGMFAFSLAFALPFTLFAIFPSWLSSLPKSGGWLNAVKVVLGFIELALALKFLSVADQVYHWGILDREIYLALWIVIFTLMGFYLLGKLKFSHDSELKYVSVPRLFFAIATFGFVVYLIPGLFGAPLKALSGYLPPQTTHDFDLNSIIHQNNGRNTAVLATNELCEPAKYDEFLNLPHGLTGYFDLEQAKACAAAQGKPIFIDFTGHGCVNCREMEANVWSDPAVLKRLRKDYVIAALYVDDRTELPQSEWYTSAYDGKEKKTLGKKYADYQITKFNVNAQPYYVLMDAQENVLVKPIAYDLSVENFVNFLDAGVAAYKATHDRVAQK
ncbi:protein-disulfide reductase DsbD family protein [Pontibacter akesuensis]|uniref:Thiol:disulfide interchange protein DsbD n=1 Tax=Pontibacter akesuensis TaxID=388950 RepID=A0A1I7K8W3_9BACT|nr:thioredoxin family protein [Pontibacter akesuensis]GHA74186.1 thiol:disulfide interchange protein DsbD [Pontibacter akesuensis]SFU93857.1 thiol:disulfide interchange protein DsbD [Pontibacter akesuensis]